MKTFLFVVMMLSLPPLVLGGNEGSWTVGERLLPPPAGASVQLQESLRERPAPDVDASRARFPGTEEKRREFLESIPGRQEVLNRVAREEATRLGATIREVRINGALAYHITPFRVAPAHAGHLFVHIHGGAWFRGEGIGATPEGTLIADHLGIPVLSIAYRMPPEHPHPAPIDDVVAVWRGILEDHDPAYIAMGGTSAGGNITLGAMHRFKDEGLPLPGALFLGTPAVDLTKTGDSRFINEGIDRIVPSWEGETSFAADLYAGGADPTHPYLSPIYGDFSGFPPSYIISGTRDLLLSDAVRVHRALRRAGVGADLHIYEGQSHGEYMLRDLPETREHFAELNAFLLGHLGQ